MINLEFLSGFKYVNGIYRDESVIQNTYFDKLYYELRNREGRNFSDQDLKKLPSLPDVNSLASEFQIRKGSANRLILYLKSIQTSPLSILEIGCGNGWLSNMLCTIPGSKVFGIDTVRSEIEQAARVFPAENLFFIYADVNNLNFATQEFDIVIFSASIQYFPGISNLVTKISKSLKPNGEIHFLESPVYQENEIENAKAGSKSYYSKMGFAPLSDFYFHHTESDFRKLNADWLFTPTFLKNKLQILFPRLGYSPFPWLRIRKSSLKGEKST